MVTFHPRFKLIPDTVDEIPMNQLLGHPTNLRFAVGPQAGRKGFTLQTLPGSDQDEDFPQTLSEVARFSLHAGVAAKAQERNTLERLCR